MLAKKLPGGRVNQVEWVVDVTRATNPSSRGIEENVQEVITDSQEKDKKEEEVHGEVAQDAYVCQSDVHFAPLFMEPASSKSVSSDAEGSSEDNSDGGCRQVPIEFHSLVDIDDLIDNYESTSGFRLVIIRSNSHARTYVCKSHVNCCFRARFGPKRGTDMIVFKANMARLYHEGKTAPKTAKGGRAHKKRLKGRLESVVEHVSTVKHAKPIAKDLMKAAASLKHVSTTYHQSYRVVRDVALRRWEEHEISFQMIKPYLDKFKELNPGSTTKCETRGAFIERIFVCPGIMKTTLRHVRPVMSLDAAHLKSKWKGTLYTASVKTGSDEIYPVAIGIMNGNENEAGWTWFLRLLESAIEIWSWTDQTRNINSNTLRSFPTNKRG